MPADQNAFKQNLKRPIPMAGVWAMSGSPVVAEALGYAGYDFIVIDMEHAPNDMPRALSLLRAVAGTGTACVVRLPWNDPVLVKQMLDMGAQTLMFPFIQTVEDARCAVAATRYPPEGIRGFAAMSRASNYGTRKDYCSKAAEEICVILQLETASAVSGMDAITAVPGVDSIFVGPGDLSADLGHLGRPGEPEVQKLLADAAAQARAAGMPAGILAPEPGTAANYLEYGYDWVAIGSDLALMMGRAGADLAAMKDRKRS